MKCFICDTELNYFFTKTYREEPFATYMADIGPVDYHKCPQCGFTASKTHCDLDAKTWEELNHNYHTFSEAAKKEKRSKGNPPPYLDQAVFIKLLSDNKIINGESLLDFAGGHGTLSHLLSKHFETTLPVYDPFMQKKNRDIYLSKEQLEKYGTVINSALFEHVTSRDDLDEIHDLVNEDGCMIIHTVVCENVPNDESWFYIRIPVHCAFHTNKSMSILMNQWGYSSSIYCPAAKCWALFKKDLVDVPTVVNEINQECQAEYLLYKEGFLDYWKGF